MEIKNTKLFAKLMKSTNIPDFAKKIFLRQCNIYETEGDPKIKSKSSESNADLESEIPQFRLGFFSSSYFNMSFSEACDGNIDFDLICLYPVAYKSFTFMALDFDRTLDYKDSSKRIAEEYEISSELLFQLKSICEQFKPHLKMIFEKSRKGIHMYIICDISSDYILYLIRFMSELKSYLNSKLSKFDLISDVTYPSSININNQVIKFTNRLICSNFDILSTEESHIDDIIEIDRAMFHIVDSKMQLTIEFENKEMIRRVKQIVNSHQSGPSEKDRIYELFCFDQVQLFSRMFESLPNGETRHIIRVIALNYYLVKGLTNEMIHNKFMNFTDYQPTITEKYINYARNRPLLSVSRCYGMRGHIKEICNECPAIKKKWVFDQRYEIYSSLFDLTQNRREYIQKFTRAGISTYVIKTALEKNIKMLVVEPSHNLITELEDIAFKLHKNSLHLHAASEKCLKIDPEIRNKISKLKFIDNEIDCSLCDKRSKCEYMIELINLKNMNFDICFASYQKVLMSTALRSCINQFSLIFFDEFSNIFKSISSIPIDFVKRLKFETLDLQLMKKNLLSGKKYQVLNYSSIASLQKLLRHNERFISKQDLHIFLSFFNANSNYFQFDNMHGNIYNIGSLIDIFHAISEIQTNVICADSMSIDSRICELMRVSQRIIKDSFSMDSQFSFVSDTISGMNEELKRCASRYIRFMKSKNDTCEYFRSDRSRGISLLSESKSKDIMILEPSFAPLKPFELRAEFFKDRYGIELDPRDLRDEDAVNEFYQSLSRYKYPAEMIGRTIYYNESFQRLILLLIEKINTLNK